MHQLRTLSSLRHLLLPALVALLASPAFLQQARQPQGAAAAELQAAETSWPVAVRWWGQGFVTVETWWGLTVAIDPYDPGIGYADPGVAADLVLITHAHRDHNNPDLVQGEPTVFRGLDDDGNVRELRVAVDRKPNEDAPRAGEESELGELSAHAVRAFTIASFHDE